MSGLLRALLCFAAAGDLPFWEVLIACTLHILSLIAQIIAILCQMQSNQGQQYKRFKCKKFGCVSANDLHLHKIYMPYIQRVLNRLVFKCAEKCHGNEIAQFGDLKFLFLSYLE